MGESIMTAVYTAVTAFLTQIMTYVSTVITNVTGNDVLIVFCLAVPLISFAIGLLSRLVRRVFR